MLKLLHTSDVQLDAPFGFLGDQGRHHRKRLKEAFARIVDLAGAGKFDVMLIAGDLFDSNQPQQTTVDFVVSQIAGLGIPVFILPGNHDCYDETSIYRRAPFPQNAHILTEQPTVIELPDLDLTIYGNPIVHKQSRTSPMQCLQATGRTQWHVALAHGNLDRPDIVDPARPIRRDEIVKSGMDYIAMGDWHAFADYSQGAVKAFYSGAPEPTSPGQSGAGYVASVELHEGEAQVRPERVGTVATKEIEVSTEGRNTADIAQAVLEHADNDLMLRVTLVGLSELGTVVDTEMLENELASAFYHLSFKDESHPALDKISDEDYPEDLVIGKFVRLMRRHIESARDDEDRRRAAQALQIGVALLEGKEVI